MGSYTFGNFQAEKTNAILKNRQLKKIASFFRYVELCVVLVLISRLSLQLPVAVKSSSDYFRGFSVFVISPRVVFVIGNVIIITLFAQSGQFSAKGSPSKNSVPDFYEEFIQNSTKSYRIGEQTKYEEKHSIKNQSVDGEKTKYPEKQSTRKEPGSIRNQRIDGYPEKQSIRIEQSIKNHRINGYHIKYPEDQRKQSQNVNTGLELKHYRRSLTEKFSHANAEKQHHVLQRSETEKSCKSIEAAAKVARISYPEDNMSNDEFRRTVEAFIARQQRLRREEESYMA
ncbi:hypothetical protein L6164_035543 [Bauhinia variegata]|uniref:Uncharacterized protein n=1 Tax=Bauhinia variegata TaxID=167791 RepID=A0ACB9KEB5_BAUVA|nr:hypothetical protein L6164_035543 [Bauhinia variegata]